MNVLLRTVAFAATSCALALTSAAAVAADLKVGLSVSLSGPNSSLGVPFAKGMQAAVAHRPEIAGRKVQLIVLDNASDTTAAARNARKLVDEEKVDVLMGTSGVPATMAMAQVGRESQTPMIGTSPILLQPSDPQWVVTVGAADAADGQRRDRADETRWRQERRLHRLLRRVGRSRLRRTGEGGARGRKVVANERYARADPSVAGQVLKIVAAKPDAVMTGGAGTPGALPYLALAERGYKGRIYGQHGLINADFVRVGGAAAQGSPMPTGPIIVAEQLPDDHPTKKVGLDFRNVFRKVNNEATTDAFSAYSFDAYQVFADAAARALTKSEAGTPAFRQALREAILSTREVVGVHGVYNFKPGNLHGVDERARVIVELHKGNWKLVP